MIDLKHIKRLIEKYKINKFLNALYEKVSEVELYEMAAKYGEIYRKLPENLKFKFLDAITKAVRNVRKI